MKKSLEIFILSDLSNNLQDTDQSFIEKLAMLISSYNFEKNGNLITPYNYTKDVKLYVPGTAKLV